VLLMLQCFPQLCIISSGCFRFVIWGITYLDSVLLSWENWHLNISSRNSKIWHPFWTADVCIHVF
jgi:hypothetical protein